MGLQNTAGTDNKTPVWDYKIQLARIIRLLYGTTKYSCTQLLCAMLCARFQISQELNSVQTPQKSG